MSTVVNQPCYIILIYFIYNLIQFADCCQFPDHWYGNWYQAGVRITVTIERGKISSKGPCLESDGDKYLIEDIGQRSCYRCMVIHEKHRNVLQYKETFCQSRRTLREVCLHLSGDHLLYSLFRDISQPIPCPFDPPYTFTYSRGHGECMSPPSTIDACTDSSRFLIQYQACPDIHGSESAMEEIECFAMWKESSHRYLVGKVIQQGTTAGAEDSYKCFVLEKLGGGQANGKTTVTLKSSRLGKLPIGPEEVEYKVAQSGDSTCSGLFSPMEASITMTLKRSSYNWTCKFPTWMTKRRYWHTLDYSQSYSLDDDDSNLVVSNITQMNGGSKFEDDYKRQIKMKCAEDQRSTEDFAQLVCRYLSVCRQGFVCVTLYKRSEHIIELQTGLLSKRPEDACTDRYFELANTPFITLVTPEPETKVCPFFGNFVVNGVSRLGKIGAKDKLDVVQEQDISLQQSRLSNVDIMGTYTDNLLQDYFQPEEEHQQLPREYDSSTDDSVAGQHHHSIFSTSRVKRTDKKLPPDPRILRSKRKTALANKTNNNNNINNSSSISDSSNNRSGEFSTNFSSLTTDNSTRNNSVAAIYTYNSSDSDRRKNRTSSNFSRIKRDTARSSSKKSTCVLNFNKVLFGCRSPDTMEFRSDCPLFSSDIISIYLCHGSWYYNISRNASIHYLVTTPLSRSSKTVRRYCFMYQTNENSSTIQFTSSSDTCHRDLAPGIDGVLTFNITPVYAGQCAGLITGASQKSYRPNFSICLMLLLNYYYYYFVTRIR